MVITYKEWDIEIEVESFNPGCAPIINLRPEGCDEGDPGEVEFTILSIVPVAGSAADIDNLPSEETLSQMIVESLLEDAA